MKKLLLTSVLFLTLIVPVHALYLTPASGNLSRNTTYTISLKADAPSNATAAQVRLTLAGSATILGYTSPTGVQWGPGGIGACTGGTTYTSTQICVDLANTGTIVDGTSLGTMSVRTGSSGSFTITKDSDNGYLVSSTIVANTGTAGSYTIASSDADVNVLPNTAIDDEPKSLIIIGASIFVLTGILSYILYPDFRSLFKDSRGKQNRRLAKSLLTKAE